MPATSAASADRSYTTSVLPTKVQSSRPPVSNPPLPTYRSNWRFWVVPAVRLLKTTLPLAWLIKKLFAAALRLIVTVVLAPALKLPEAEETVSQLEVLTRLQFKGVEPIFFSV